MEANEILEGNKLIAEFMVGKRRFDERMQITVLHGMQYLPGIGLDEIEWKDFELIYHKSWSWLMPAWKKFKGLQFENTQQILRVSHFYQAMTHALVCVDIETAFSILVEAIKWYNQNKQ